MNDTEEPQVGKRVVETVYDASKRWVRSTSGTIVRITKRTIRIVYDTGMTATFTLKPGRIVEPGCLGDSFRVMPWKGRP